MRRFSRNLAAFLAIALLCHRALSSAVLADADAAPVTVSFDRGPVTFGTISEGVRYFDNRKYTLNNIPQEFLNLRFTIRPGNSDATATIRAASHSTVYVFLDSDKGDNARAPGLAALYRQLTGSGWQRINGIDEVPGVHKGHAGLAAFKRTFEHDEVITIHAQGFSGCIVAARQLERSSDSDKAPPGDKVPPPPDSPSPPIPTPATAPDDSPISGPTTQTSRRQSSIRALYILQPNAGMMLGQANDFILTITPGDEPRGLSVVFAQKVGSQMTSVEGDVMRFLRIRYPNWNVAHAALTFEDRDSPHDGPSIGAAIGTLILSTIQGFEIDPKAAITGDVTADGKVRPIAGVGPKLRGAAAAACNVVAVPESNSAQVLDGMIYFGTSLASDVQVLAVNNLDEAAAVTRSDRAESLAKAIQLFSDIQLELKASSAALRTKQMQTELRRILDLAPQHLSAKLLLLFASNQQPKSLSMAASMYYVSAAAQPMLPILEISDLGRSHAPVPAGLSKSMEQLQKLRPIADPQTYPLIGAWSQFIRTWNDPHSDSETIIKDRNRVVEEMQRIRLDYDLMQKMISEGGV